MCVCVCVCIYIYIYNIYICIYIYIYITNQFYAYSLLCHEHTHADGMCNTGPCGRICTSRRCFKFRHRRLKVPCSY